MKYYKNYLSKLSISDYRVINMKMDLIWYKSMIKHLNLMKNMIKPSYTSLNPCKRCKSLTDLPKQAKIIEL